MINVLDFLKSAYGVGVLVGVGFAGLIFYIRKTKSKKDDEQLDKVASLIYPICVVVEKSIPDNTPITALQFVDAALKELCDTWHREKNTNLDDNVFKFAERQFKAYASESKKYIGQLKD